MILDTLIYSNLSPEQLATGFGLLTLGSGAIGALIAVGAMVCFLVCAGLYVYTSLCFRQLSLRLGYKRGRWIAWIPIVNLFLIPILARKDWKWGFMFLIPIANLVFFILWMWRIFERVGRDGWWALLVFIPKFGTIVFLVMLGIAAFKKK